MARLSARRPSRPGTRRAVAAYNVVRFRVRPGKDKEVLAAHVDGKANWPGLSHGVIFRTDDHSYCLIGEWVDLAALAAARPQMIATLDSFRHTLEPHPGGQGVTDAVSGPVVLDLKSGAAHK